MLESLVVGADRLDDYAFIYRLQLALSIGALLFNSFIAFTVFAGSSLPPHLSMYRVILIIDVFIDLSYLFDAIMFTHEGLLSDEGNDNVLIAWIATTLSPNSLEGELADGFSEFLKISECGANKPYLFVQLIGRQWSSIIILIMGFERFLFVIYPLWFNSNRVRRGPIIVFTMLFATLSAAVAYTNSLFVAPDEMTHFTCELTWAFGDNYGWCQSFFIIVPQILACGYNAYAEWFTSREAAFFHFGGNRNKLSAERRKIRKAKVVVLSCALFTCLPQLGVVLLRILSCWTLHRQKLLFSQLFLLKFLTNLHIYRKVCRHRRGFFHAATLWMKQRNKRRINSNDSITSISQHVIG